MTTTGILVSDFDGTMTERDFYGLVRARWWPESREDPWQDYLAGRLTHFEALNRFFARIDCGTDELARLIPSMDLDPDLGPAVARLQAAGWEVVIASAGCDWYINRHLAAAGVRATVHANPGSLLPGRGLVMELPRTSPFFDHAIGIGKVAVVRDALRRHPCVAFAGDGPPDHGPALLVPAERRFARGFLAEKLAKEGEPFQPYARWSAIADCLLGRP